MRMNSFECTCVLGQDQAYGQFCRLKANALFYGGLVTTLSELWGPKDCINDLHNVCYTEDHEMDPL